MEHLNLKTFRALKCIRRGQPGLADSFAEADILKNLRHPAIPIIYDIEEDDEFVFIFEEYIAGESLDSYLSKNKVPTNKLIAIFVQLCEVVRYIHDNGFLHRDIKPENLLYDGSTIRLLDYGSAVRTSKSAGAKTGTKGYAAPEMYGEGRTLVEADIYSIGIVMLEAFTQSRDVDMLAGRCPQAIANIIKKCLHHAQGERFDSVRSLERALMQINKKKFTKKNVSLRVAVCGATAGCGVTYCARAFARALNGANRRCLLVEKNDHGDFFRLFRDAGHILFRSGIYRVCGIDMVPEYNGCVAMDFERDYEGIVYDYGEVTDDNIEEILAADIVCLVGIGDAFRRDFLTEKHRLLTMIHGIGRGRFFTVVNLTGGRAYMSLLRTEKYINPVRMPFDPSNKCCNKRIVKCFEKYAK